jgi:hypothetical protein
MPDWFDSIFIATMLPSTGYFKTINCPFYDSGLCERPYCHFRHVKRGVFLYTYLFVAIFELTFLK